MIKAWTLRDKKTKNFVRYNLDSEGDYLSHESHPTLMDESECHYAIYQQNRWSGGKLDMEVIEIQYTVIEK